MTARSARLMMACGLLVAAAGAVWLLLAVRGVLAPFALAAVLAYLVGPLVERLHRRGLGRPLAILLSYALVTLGVAGVAVIVVPDLVRELGHIAGVLPFYAHRADTVLAGLRAGTGGLPAPVVHAIDVGIAHVQARAEGAIRSATSVLLAFVAGIAALALAPFLAYYLLADMPRFRQRLIGAVPPASRPGLAAYLRDLDAMLSGYLRGQLLTAAGVGILATLAVSLLHLGYALTLGLLAGLGELVPYFGPVLGAVPALALAGARSLQLLIAVAVAYTVIQQIESSLLHPYIVGHTTGLHPLTVVFALLVGGDLGGLPGLLLGVPVAGALQVTGVHLIRAAVAWRRDLGGAIVPDPWPRALPPPADGVQPAREPARRP